MPTRTSPVGSRMSLQGPSEGDVLVAVLGRVLRAKMILAGLTATLLLEVAAMFVVLLAMVLSSR